MIDHAMATSGVRNMIWNRRDLHVGRLERRGRKVQRSHLMRRSLVSSFIPLGGSHGYLGSIQGSLEIFLRSTIYPSSIHWCFVLRQWCEVDYPSIMTLCYCLQVPGGTCWLNMVVGPLCRTQRCWRCKRSQRITNWITMMCHSALVMSRAPVMSLAPASCPLIICMYLQRHQRRACPSRSWRQ